jgi:hypothetical protein
MQRDRLQEEQEQEQKARKGELTMITAKEGADEAQGVWDGQTQELLESGMSEDEREVLRRAEARLDVDNDDIIDDDEAEVGALGESMVRTDGPGIGPNGVPIGDAPGVGEDYDDTIRDAMDTNARNPRAGEQTEMPELPVAGRGEMVRPVQVLDRPAEKRVIRVNADLDPTIGRTQYHFEKGKRYRVPLHVAMHLHEKGYVSSFG